MRTSLLPIFVTIFVLRFRGPKGGTIHGQQINMALSQRTKARASLKASPRARTRTKEVRPVPVQEKASHFGTLRTSAVSHRQTRCGGKRKVRANKAAKPTFQNSGYEVILHTMPSGAWANLIIVGATVGEVTGGTVINGIGEDELLHGVIRVCFSLMPTPGRSQTNTFSYPAALCIVHGLFCDIRYSQ